MQLEHQLDPLELIEHLELEELIVKVELLEFEEPINKATWESLVPEHLYFIEPTNKAALPALEFLEPELPDFKEPTN